MRDYPSKAVVRKRSFNDQKARISACAAGMSDTRDAMFDMIQSDKDDMKMMLNKIQGMRATK